MTDTDFEAQMNAHTTARSNEDFYEQKRGTQPQDMTPEEWQRYLGESARRIRKANAEFCRKHPEQCI